MIAEDLEVTTLWDFIRLALMFVADTAIILLSHWVITFRVIAKLEPAIVGLRTPLLEIAEPVPKRKRGISAPHNNKKGCH